MKTLVELVTKDGAASVFAAEAVALAADMDHLGASFQELCFALKSAKVTIGTWREAVKVVRMARAKAEREAAKAKGAEAAAAVPEPVDLDPRPIVRFDPGVEGVDLHDAIDQSLVVLAGDLELFERGGVLVRVVRAVVPEPAAPAANAPKTGPFSRPRRAVAETPKIEAVELDTVRERLTRVARFQKYDERMNGWAFEVPKEPLIRGLMLRRRFPGIRRIAGVVEAPSLRADGSVLDTPGHDAASGLLYIPNATYPKIDESPTRAESTAALALLGDVFIDFPYQSPAHRYVPVAALLTLFARPAIAGPTPCFLFDGNSQGAGKSLPVECCSVIFTGRAAEHKDYPTTDEELDKVLAGYAFEGCPIVSFDNVTRVFGGRSLDMVLQTDTPRFRVLSKNINPASDWRAVLFASGVAMAVTRDIRQRSLICRVESKYENPDDRPIAAFAHPERAGNLKEYCLANRPDLVAAALTVLRGYIAAGCPDPLRMARYPRWGEIVPSAIRWAGGPNVLECVPTSSEEGGERQIMVALLDGWRRLQDGVEGFTFKQLIDRLYPPERQDITKQQAPDMYDGLRGAIEQLLGRSDRRVAPDTVKLQKKLRDKRGQRTGSLYLETARKEDGSTRESGGSAVWRVYDDATDPPPKLPEAKTKASVGQPEEDVERAAIQDD